MQIPSLQELLEAGVHFGHKVSRGNPRMSPFIYGAREGVHIIDLTLSEKYLKEAAEFAHDLGKNNGVLLYIGTKKQAEDITKEAAIKVGAPYLTFRFMGGFLTNFEEISKNIKKLKELKEAKIKGTLKKYTKKEQLLLDRRAADLEKNFVGVSDMEKLPDAIFLLDANKDVLAVREANRVGVKIIAVTDTNADPTLVDFPIPANDDAIKSIKIVVDTITAAYEEGKEEATKKAAKDEADTAAKNKKEEAKKLVEESMIPELMDEVADLEEKVEKKA